MNRILPLLALTISALAAQPAAAATYDFYLYTATTWAAGTFTTVTVTPSPITKITGYIDFVPIAGLSQYASASNILYPAFPFIDFSGVSFTAGGVNFNLYGYQNINLINSVTDPFGAGLTPDPVLFGSVTLASATAVPEPATWGLMTVGLGLVGWARRWRKTVVAA